MNGDFSRAQFDRLETASSAGGANSIKSLPETLHLRVPNAWKDAFLSRRAISQPLLPTRERNSHELEPLVHSNASTDELVQSVRKELAVDLDIDEDIVAPFPKRIFLGPHILRADHASASKDTLTLQHDQASLWRRTLAKGHHHTVETDVKNTWVGQSFEIGKFEAATYRRLVKLRDKRTHEQAEAAKVMPEKSPEAGTSRASMKYGNGHAVEPEARHSTTPGILLTNLREQEQNHSQPSDIKGKGKSFLPSRSTNSFLTARPIFDSPAQSLRPPSPQPTRVDFAFGQARRGDDAPVPPEEVLARPDPPIQAADKEDRFFGKRKRLSSSQDPMRQANMLFASAWCRQVIPGNFSDDLIRKFDLRIKSWREACVVWTGRVIEIYKFHRYRRKAESTLIDRFHLSANGAAISLFTAADYTIVLTCPEISRRRALLSKLKNSEASLKHSGQSHLEIHASTSGTAVFFLRPASMTTACDWYLDLWLQLGGRIPDTLNIRVPKVDVRLSIPIPSTRQEANELIGGDLADDIPPFALLSPDAAASICLNSMSHIPQFKLLINSCAKNGWTPRLAWRRSDYIDWMIWDTDVTGKPRYSPIMAGFALSQRFTTTEDGFEFKMAAPYPTHAISKGKAVEEPPAIEGFMTRVHGPKARDRLYVASIGPNLFLVPASDSYPPEPPFLSALASTQPDHQMAGLFGGPYSIAPKEGKRFGVLLSVMRQAKVAQAAVNVATEAYLRVTDDLDPEHLAFRYKANERTRLYHLLRNNKGFIDLRSIVRVRVDSKNSSQVFIELIKNRTLHFEVSSSEIAAQWVDKLNGLSEYWYLRKNEDAMAQISLHKGSQMAERFTPRDQRRFLPFRDALQEDDTFLGIAYNISLFNDEPGRPFGVRLYVRQTPHPRFKQRRCVVLGGSIFFYQTAQHTYGGRPIFPAYFAAKGRIDLIDCYVVTGSLCGQWERHVAKDGFSPADEDGYRMPRIYADNLTSADGQEDCTFALWQKPRRGWIREQEPKVWIFIARSRVERDQTVAVINIEIEKALRERGVIDDGLRHRSSTRSEEDDKQQDGIDDG